MFRSLKKKNPPNPLFQRGEICKKFNLFLYIFFIFIGVLFLFIQNSFSLSQNNTIPIIQLNDDTINPVTADYIINSISQAEEDKSECLIIKLDTPGGLLSSTRRIIKKMLSAKIPIVVYISPSGSRAGSAGVFITYASHVAAMAPSTNIGAAHPVKMGGGTGRKHSGDWKELKKMIEALQSQMDKVRENTKTPEKIKSTDNQKESEIKENPEDLSIDENPMESKIMQDTVAFIRAIAKERKRNEEWAVKSVTKSLSIPNKEALEKGVVEIIATNIGDLLNQLDGREVIVNGKTKILNTKGAYIERVEMDARQKFFNILADPNIAYYLMILGFYGLLFEVTHPGFGVPGIMGTIFLILSFYSMQTLPLNYAGLALLVLGLILLISEAFVPGIGLLALGGLVSLILGSMMLFDSVDPVMRVSPTAITALSIMTGMIIIFLIRLVLRSQKSKIHGGKEGLVGEVGEVVVNLMAGKKGKVYVHGELWNAVASEDISKGEDVYIEGLEGLTLKVRRK